MKRSVFALFAAIALIASCKSENYALRVNTLIGNGGEGLNSTFLFPGATYPFGMVQFTPTFKEPQTGFTGLHLSGVGCYCLGQFPMLPKLGELSEYPGRMFGWKENITDKKGHAGYFECMVDGLIHTELSVTPHTGMASMCLDSAKTVTILIGTGFEINNDPRLLNYGGGKVNPDGSFEGHAVAHDFCSAHDTPFDIYYYAECDSEPIATGSWYDGEIYPGVNEIEGLNSGVYMTFPAGKSLKYKFAISFVSIENAKMNLRSENPGWNFSSVRRNAEKAWDKYLSMAEVHGEPEREEQFYTHLYHALIHPCLASDVNSEYMGSDFKVHKEEGGHKAYHMFSNWDTYRTQIQLISMLAPDVASDIVLSHQRFSEFCSGGLPRWTMANYETNVMQGDPGALICCNALAFGARDFDLESLAALMYREAEDPALLTQDVPARPYLKEYLDGCCSPSLALEYCCADFAISRLALECGDSLKAAEYLKRSSLWKNYFNPCSGWIQGRNPDGTFREFRERGGDWMEASHAIYHWMVPFNLAGIIEATGGREASEERLDFLFTELEDLYDGEHFAACNEPGFGIPWTYNWVGRPDKTSQVIHRILTEVYSTGMTGVPGNDDLGAMGSWYTFACLGLYPLIPGYGAFAVNTPIFEDITLHLPGGDLRIEGGSRDFACIDSMTVNGKSYDAPWIEWSEVCSGGLIRYTTTPGLGNGWGTEVSLPSFE